jgi:hypothetical protein
MHKGNWIINKNNMNKKQLLENIIENENNISLAIENLFIK